MTARAVACIGLALAFSGACSNQAGISVDLRTDFVPAREFVRVECTLTEAAGSDSGVGTARHAAHNISASGDYLAGVRVAEIGGLPPGAHTLRVDLLDLHAGVVASRRVDVTVTGHTSVTVVLTRNCVGIVCPRGGDPDLTECVDGHCVDPRCAPDTPELCPTPRCASDTECTAAGCGRASCAGGTCLVAPSDGRCGAGEICSIDLSCVPAPTDAGVGAGDAGADGAAADDASVDPHCPGCTSDPCVTRTCGASGCTATNVAFGAPCDDDGNACTADLCDGNGSCTHAPVVDGTACGTGEFHCCRGTCVDVTADTNNCGACGVHCVAGHPCMRIPTTNFGTCGCTAPYDSACAGYGPGAWCSPGGRCQCTCGCPTSGPCDMRCGAACGTTGATCRDINGMDNWCYY